MSRQIEQALLSLMPTYGSDLPPSLVELAGSLLAQSRHRASTLKADEEIARQLKTSLNLPPIEPRPPIPPRIYNRLYTHLDNILPNPSSTPRSSRVRTPSSKIRENGTPTTATTTTTTTKAKSPVRAVPSRGTPTKEMSLAKFRTSTRAASAASSKARQVEVQGSKGGGRAPWIQPVIRHMCAAAGQKRLAPTVLAGIEHALAPGGRPTEDEWVVRHAADLVAALYFFVVMRVRSITSGAEIDREGYVPVRREILALLTQAGHQVTVPEHQEADAFWQGWRDVKPRDFDAAVAKVNENSWLSGDWYEGIADVLDSTTTRADADDDAHMSDGGGGHEDRQAPLPTTRADAMLQERNDFLSEARKADFAVWRDRMLAKIAQATPKECAMEGFTHQDA
ncbi:hypothetical protein E4U41_001393 [Claviceps citrina]|nr:hypothetical protein E4U41_001393 [Claviceps citrina]